MTTPSTLLQTPIVERLRREDGLSLMEMMVALVILMIGLLGMAQVF
jgi:Tfp pilus assembly protein PilV